MITAAPITMVGDGPVVVVDDDSIDIELMTLAHRSSEITNELLAFQDGPSFLAYLTEAVETEAIPSIVFLDINMPGMNGFEVLTEMRRHPELAQLPVAMFLSNSDSPKDRERAESFGAHLQQKFIRPKQMTAYLNSLIG